MILPQEEIKLHRKDREPVLIVGPEGSRKSQVARAIHQTGPFDILLAEDVSLHLLFGQEKGSGILESMHGGTLILDHAHRLSPEVQRMLCVPMDGRLLHLKSQQPVDIRFLFCTDPENEKNMGATLNSRIMGRRILLASLVERKAEIPTIIAALLEEYAQEFELENVSLAPSLQEHLLERKYLSDMAELTALMREAVRRAAFEMESMITVEHLPKHFRISTVGKSSLERPAIKNPKQVPGEKDDGSGLWNEAELEELAAIRRNRFKISAAEKELGLSPRSRTLTNHLRGYCFKALCKSDFDIGRAARVVVGRDDEALLDRTQNRLRRYLDKVRNHVESHSTKMLFNNLPRDYRKFMTTAIERVETGKS